MWTEIKTQSDIDSLLELYGFFHDSCIRDFHISTRAYVEKNLSMGFDNTLTISILFQRQFSPNSVLELKFEDAVKFNYYPYDDIIYDASIIIEDGLFYWTESEINDLSSTWICGEKLYWRFRPELLGNIERMKI